MAETLKAGRELDALIAEKVMGWQWASQYNIAVLMSPRDFKVEVTDAPWMGWVPGIAKGAERDLDGTRFYDSSRKPPNRYPAAPPYSTDIAAAWQVVEKMRERFKNTDAATWSRWNNAAADVLAWGTHYTAEQVASAICRTALFAVGSVDVVVAQRASSGESNG